MWRPLCCSLRATVASSSNLNKEEQDSSVTTEHQDEKPLHPDSDSHKEDLEQCQETIQSLTTAKDVAEPNEVSSNTPEEGESQHQEDFRVRSLSASEVKSRNQDQLRTGVLEGISENNISRSTLHVIPNPSLVTCASDSSESLSLYTTPPTSRHPSVSSHHPLAKTAKKARSPTSLPRNMPSAHSHSPTRGSVSISPTSTPLRNTPSAHSHSPTRGSVSISPFSTLPRNTTSSQSHSPTRGSVTSSQNNSHGYQELLSKIEEDKKDRERQHDEFLKAIADFSGKLDKVLSEMKAKRTSDSELCTDGTHSDKPMSPTYLYESSSTKSLLPPNTPVSVHVLLKVSELVPHKWKFLARRLGVEEHEVQQIRGDNQGDVHEQSYQMLLKWTQSNGGGSYQALGEALRSTFGEKLHSDYVKMVVETEKRHSFVANSQ